MKYDFTLPNVLPAHGLSLCAASQSILLIYYTTSTSIWTDSDCCAFAPKIFGQVTKNTISRNYKITNRRLLSWANELVQNVSLWSQVPQSTVVVSAQGIVVSLETDADKRIDIFPVWEPWTAAQRANIYFTIKRTYHSDACIRIFLLHQFVAFVGCIALQFDSRGSFDSVRSSLRVTVPLGRRPRDLHVLFHLHSGQWVEQHHSEEVFTHVAGDRVLFSDVGAQAGAISEEAEQNGPAQVRQPALQNLQDFKEEPAIEQHSQEQQGRKATATVHFGVRVAHRPPGSNNGEQETDQPLARRPCEDLE